MIIDKYSGVEFVNGDYLTTPPDPFVKDSEKQKPSYIKKTMDYYVNKAYTQYFNNKHTFAKNYDFVKGIVNLQDFYQEDDRYKTFVDTLMGQEELPQWVKRYSILATPINTLVGELSTRPDVHRVRAFDDFSKNETIGVLTDMLQDYVTQQALRRIVLQLQQQGQDISKIDPQQIQQQAVESVADVITDYTSEYEIWGNLTLEALKAELNIKEKSEDAFRDLYISNTELYHTYEDGSARGFNVEVVNPKNHFKLTTPDEKYVNKAFVSGIIRVMEISEIIQRFPQLTKKEIDRLREVKKDGGLYTPTDTNWGTGTGSIHYDTYSRLREQEAEIINSELHADGQGIDSIIGNESDNFTDYYYTVIECYIRSKKLVGQLDYLDEDGIPQSMLVDEHYKVGAPNEISIQWGYINQWYKGIKIGSEIYFFEPYTFTKSVPIVGVTHEIKNTLSVAPIEIMKPYQVLFDLCMNQLYELLGKEKGVLGVVSTRYIPRTKDGDAQDDLDIWEEEAKRAGIIFVDDSPENIKAGGTMNNFTRMDLTRSAEIQTRYTLANQLRADCWALAGMSPQRLGDIAATETATGTNTALSKSYAQTEPLFKQHDYVLDQLYQVMIEAAQTVESQKQESSLSYINNYGTEAIFKIAGAEIDNRDLHVIPVSRNKDADVFQALRSLAQPMLQNGATPHTIAQLYSSNSIRQWQKVTKDLEDKQQALKEQQIQMQQQQLQQEQQIASAQLQQKAQSEQQQIQNDNFNRQQDRETKITVAQIAAAGYGKVQNQDLNNNGVPDVLEVAKTNALIQQGVSQNNLKMQELALKAQDIVSKREIAMKKLEVDKANMINDMNVAKTNLLNSKIKKGDIK